MHRAILYDLWCFLLAHGSLLFSLSRLVIKLGHFPSILRWYSLYACPNKFTIFFMFPSKESVQVIDLLLPIWLNSKKNYFSSHNGGKYGVDTENKTGNKLISLCCLWGFLKNTLWIQLRWTSSWLNRKMPQLNF